MYGIVTSPIKKSILGIVTHVKSQPAGAVCLAEARFLGGWIGFFR